jgi:hypothetical protein
MKCCSSGTAEGWFQGFNFDWSTRFREDVVLWKIEGTREWTEMDKCVQENDIARALEHGEKAHRLWEKVAC